MSIPLNMVQEFETIIIDYGNPRWNGISVFLSASLRSTPRSYTCKQTQYMCAIFVSVSARKILKLKSRNHFLTTAIATIHPVCVLRF